MILASGARGPGFKSRTSPPMYSGDHCRLMMWQCYQKTIASGESFNLQEMSSKGRNSVSPRESETAAESWDSIPPYTDTIFKMLFFFRYHVRGQTKALILILNFLIMKKIFLLRAATTTISGQHLYDQSSESQVGFPLQKLLQQKNAQLWIWGE